MPFLERGRLFGGVTKKSAISFQKALLKTGTAVRGTCYWRVASDSHRFHNLPLRPRSFVKPELASQNDARSCVTLYSHQSNILRRFAKSLPSSDFPSLPSLKAKLWNQRLSLVAPANDSKLQIAALKFLLPTVKTFTYSKKNLFSIKQHLLFVYVFNIL